MAKEQQSSGGGIDGWTRSLISAALVVAGSWYTVTNEIHGYIDARLTETVDKITLRAGAIGEGQMLMVMDTVHAMDTRMVARINNLEELIGVRPSPRTIVVPPDTVARNRMERELKEIRGSIELLLDGAADPVYIRTRAHNEKQ